MSKQALSDRFLSLRHSLSGDDLAWSVCKATTEEERAPKVKHLSYLEFCTNTPNVSIPKLAQLLYERSLNQNIVVVFKTLITVHHLMCHGNEVFIRYLASWRNKFHTERFLRKTRSHDCGMFMCLATYACYVNEKALSYRKLAVDFCKTTREHRNDELRNMDFEQLLSTLSVIHKQLFILLQFYCSRSMMTNVVIAAAFKLLYADLIKLFACYNNGIIRLLETFFSLNRRQLQKVLNVYRKFVSEMDKVSEFLKLAKEVGIESNSTDLTKAPSGILIALENHVSSLERRKSSSSKKSELLSICSERISNTASEKYSYIGIGRETLPCSPKSSDMTWNDSFSVCNSPAVNFCNSNPFIDDTVHFQQKTGVCHEADLQGNQSIVNDCHLWSPTNPFLCDVENLVSNDTVRSNFDSAFSTQHNRNSVRPAVVQENYKISERASTSFTSDLQSSIAELMCSLSSNALQRFSPKRNASFQC